MTISFGSLNTHIVPILRSSGLVLSPRHSFYQFSVTVGYIRYGHSLNKNTEEDTEHNGRGKIITLNTVRTQKNLLCARGQDVETDFLESKNCTDQIRVLRDSTEGCKDQGCRAKTYFEDKVCKDAASTDKTGNDVQRTALEALASRAFTTMELRKKLHGKKFPLDVVESVIADFQRRGLINDYLYAESFTQSKWLSLSWGPKRIKQVLLRKGINDGQIDEAMRQVFQGRDNVGDDEEFLCGMSKLSVDRLFDQSLKQWLKSKNVALEMRKSRIVRWLQYRGFNWQVTKFILQRLMTKYPS